MSAVSMATTRIPEKFVEEILVGKFNMKTAIVGANYKFGHKSEGNINLLFGLGEKFDYKVKIVTPVMYNNKIISSTLIRESIQSGNVEKAAKLLGRNYSIQGKVIHGSNIGKTINIPTANLTLDDDIVIPSIGTYETETLINGLIYRSVTNVGLNPTVKDYSTINIETHILDFNLDIYQKDIEVFFIKRIRDEKIFDTIDQLKNQILKDIEIRRKR
jgi:riboflavin kinase/FMN adenylyltransferase